MMTLLALSTLYAADNLVPNGGFSTVTDGAPTAWRFAAQRAEVAPTLACEAGAVRLTGVGPRTFGTLTASIAEVRGGAWYRLAGRYRVDGVEHPGEQIRVRVLWLDGDGRGLRSDWVNRRRALGDGWTAVEHTVPAPDDAVRAELELSLRWTAGSVWFDDLTMTATAAPPPRRVKIATVCYVPSGHDPDENRRLWAEKCAEAGRLGADLVCLGEGITVVGNGRGFVDVAEPADGPTRAVLGRVAAEYGLWICAGIYERDGADCYNTAILIDRQGRLAGRYRKIHLPESEAESGLTPGHEFPVFQTDFGTVGIQICYDAMFPEMARGLALAGAEIILTPIWGDGRYGGQACEVVSRARAMDHGVWYVTSNYSQRRSLIVDPWGTVRADTAGSEGLALVEADLDERRREHWLSVEAGGWWPGFTAQERRPTAYGPLAR